MSAFTATQMMVSAPVVAKASAASKAKAVAPKGKVSFSAKVGVSNATEKKTNAFYIWKSQNNKCVHVRAVREQQGPGRARAGRVSSFTHFQLGLVPRRLRPLSCCASAELLARAVWHASGARTCAPASRRSAKLGSRAASGAEHSLLVPRRAFRLSCCTHFARALYGIWVPPAGRASGPAATARRRRHRSPLGLLSFSTPSPRAHAPSELLHARRTDPASRMRPCGTACNFTMQLRAVNRRP
jgi:hypothetical protein